MKYKESIGVVCRKCESEMVLDRTDYLEIGVPNTYNQVEKIPRKIFKCPNCGHEADELIGVEV